MVAGFDSRNKLHIAYIFMDYPVPSETFALRDIRALRSAGHVVDTYSLLDIRRRKWLVYLRHYLSGIVFLCTSRHALHLAIRILFSSGWQSTERFKTLLLLPIACFLASRLIRNKPDIVHAFWGHYPSLVVLLAQRYLSNSRFTMFLGAYDLGKNLPVSNWAAQISCVVFTHANVNIIDIQSLIGQKRIEVVHRGIELDGYPDPASLNLIHREQQIFTSGRLIADKGFDRIIHFFSKVATDHENAVLYIAGAGPDKSRLIQLCANLNISDRVIFLGWLSESEVRQQLLLSRVFMLLSNKPGERLPNSVKEAMAAGCICIAAPSPGIDELIEHEVDGFVVDADDVISLIKAMNYGFYSSHAQSMSAAAARKINSQFNVHESMKIYTKIWTDCILHEE